MELLVRSAILWSCISVAVAAPGLGAGVEYDVQPVDRSDAPVVVVLGETVRYQVTISVDSGDNEGLNFFSFDLLTSLGVDQDPDGAEFDSLIEELFDFLGPGLGTPSDDDILGFEGTQGFGNDSTTGVGQDGPQVLVTGELITASDTIGVFTVLVSENANTQLLAIGSGLISNDQIDTTIGPGFEIETVEADGDLDGDGVLNGDDNCPAQGNADQADVDGDGIGDVCDLEDGSDPDETDPIDEDEDEDDDGDDDDDDDNDEVDPLDFLGGADPTPLFIAFGVFLLPVILGALVGGPIAVPLGLVIGMIWAGIMFLIGFG